jgi:hypothetical protein
MDDVLVKANNDGYGMRVVNMASFEEPARRVSSQHAAHRAPQGMIHPGRMGQKAEGETVLA